MVDSSRFFTLFYSNDSYVRSTKLNCFRGGRSMNLKLYISSKHLVISMVIFSLLMIPFAVNPIHSVKAKSAQSAYFIVRNLDNNHAIIGIELSPNKQQWAKVT